MSEELKPEISEPEKKPEPETKPAESETKPVEKITNEKELSREQKTAVKKLKDYSREAKKRVKQNDQTERSDGSRRRSEDNNSERDDSEQSDQREENKKYETSINTFLTFGGVLIAIAGLYYAHKTYLIEEIKAGVHDDIIKIQPTPTNPKQTETQKKPPKFRTL